MKKCIHCNETKESDNKCYWCKKEIEKGKLNSDHVIPLSKNGQNEIENIVVSCSRCNHLKHSLMPGEWLNKMGRMMAN